jgi:hypothetical protein
MIKYLLTGTATAVAIKLLRRYRQMALQLLQMEGVKCYLHGVRVVRLTVLHVMRMVLLLTLLGLGAVLFHAGLFCLLPWSWEVKAVLAMVLGAGYICAGVLALYVAMSEKCWMEKTGALQMLEKAALPDKEA